MLLTLFLWSYTDLRFCFAIYWMRRCACFCDLVRVTIETGSRLYIIVLSTYISSEWSACCKRCCHVTSITIGNWFQLFIIASSQSPLLLLWNGSQRSIWCQLWSGLNFWMWWEMCGFKWGSWSWRSVTLIWIWIGLIWAPRIQNPFLIFVFSAVVMLWITFPFIIQTIS